MEILIGIVIVVLVAAFVAAPFRDGAAGRASRSGRTEDPVRANLEARKQAKYREIRDTELDRAQGKLNEKEFQIQDAELRAEAIPILREIDALAGPSAEAGGEQRGAGHASGPTGGDRAGESV